MAYGLARARLLRWVAGQQARAAGQQESHYLRAGEQHAKVALNALQTLIA